MSKSSPKDTTKATAPEAASKPSGADYPVEQEERVSQQQRLRKAAAAGADALKSPIASIMSQLPSPQGAMTQKPLDPAGALAQSASRSQNAPSPSHAPSPAVPADREIALPQTNDNAEILAELRKISAWADMQRKITKWSFIFLAVFIPAMISIGLVMEQHANTNLESTVSPRKQDWYDVEHHVRAGDFDKAIAIGEDLILKTPQYPEAHQRLAAAYLASGNLDKAREHYAEAFRLFPSEENEKPLTALDRRTKSDKP